MPTLTHSSVLALDVGDKRVGVAAASLVARLPQPLITLERDDQLFPRLRKLVESEDVGTIVVGWPRDLSGNATAQTAATQAFVTELKKELNCPVVMQDEALTSANAEEELIARGKPYTKGDIDALAAVYILDDYLKTLGRENS